LTGVKDFVKTILFAIAKGPIKRYGAWNLAVGHMFENSKFAFGPKIQYYSAYEIHKASPVIHLHNS
jgi:hypothetical protein